MASDIFHKIHDFAGDPLAHKVDHQFLKLGADFDRIGDAFSDLATDALKLSDHKPAHDALIKHDVDTIGLDFIKLGVETIKLDDVLHKFDDIVLKFADQTIKLDTGDLVGDQNQLKLGDDFLKLDSDFHFTSLD